MYSKVNLLYPLICCLKLLWDFSIFLFIFYSVALFLILLSAGGEVTREGDFPVPEVEGHYGLEEGNCWGTWPISGQGWNDFSVWIVTNLHKLCSLFSGRESRWRPERWNPGGKLCGSTLYREPIFNRRCEKPKLLSFVWYCRICLWSQWNNTIRY